MSIEELIKELTEATRNGQLSVKWTIEGLGQCHLESSEGHIGILGDKLWVNNVGGNIITKIEKSAEVQELYDLVLDKAIVRDEVSPHNASIEDIVKSFIK